MNYIKLFLCFEEIKLNFYKKKLKVTKDGSTKYKDAISVQGLIDDLRKEKFSHSIFKEIIDDSSDDIPFYKEQKYLKELQEELKIKKIKKLFNFIRNNKSKNITEFEKSFDTVEANNKMHFAIYIIAWYRLLQKMHSSCSITKPTKKQTYTKTDSFRNISIQEMQKYTFSNLVKIIIKDVQNYHNQNYKIKMCTNSDIINLDDDIDIAINFSLKNLKNYLDIFCKMQASYFEYSYYNYESVNFIFHKVRIEECFENFLLKAINNKAENTDFLALGEIINSFENMLNIAKFKTDKDGTSFYQKSIKAYQSQKINSEDIIK